MFPFFVALPSLEFMVFFGRSCSKSKVFLRGVNQMLTIANEGVKKHEKHANVICERPLIENIYVVYECPSMHFYEHQLPIIIASLMMICS